MNSNDLLAVAANRVYYLDQSQHILAQNIANIDTPGFTPRIARPFADSLDQASGGTLTATSPLDLQPADSGTLEPAKARISARAPDGNAVSMSQELAAVARTQINQQYAVNIYKSYLGMFTTALGPNP